MKNERGLGATVKTHKLKPCPNCGGEAAHAYKIKCVHKWFVRCLACGETTVAKTFKFQAIRAWNREERNCANLPVW